MTDIHLHNTRTRRKERFQPLIPGRVRMYVCGPTVYDRAHIGNARPVVVFDVLYRLLRHVHGDDAVTYVRNFTDVDDKIIARAQETKAEGESLEAACHRITEETIRWYHEDMDALGALRPDHEPRCTAYIPQMVEMIERLMAEGCAYPAEGHVLFDVTKYPDYGRLSRRSLEDMQAGARVEVAPYKRNPMDFVLWKPSTPEQPGWDSPWARGRPGWHIECSAMAEALLGETFDIHGGGIDLMFPHHENEVAQSCCANHTEVMANFWLHNGFLQVEGEKMAKSLGNFFTVRDLLDQGVPGAVIRFVMLMTHYRKPLDWTQRRVSQAKRELMEWARQTDGFQSVAHDWIEKRGNEAVSREVRDALADDLNTPGAIAALRHHSNLANEGVFGSAAQLLVDLWFLGLIYEEKRGEIFAGTSAGSAPFGRLNQEEVVLISKAIELRSRARLRRDFQEADKIRDVLQSAGVSVEDTPQGPQWTVTEYFDPTKLQALE